MSHFGTRSWVLTAGGVAATATIESSQITDGNLVVALKLTNLAGYESPAGDLRCKLMSLLPKISAGVLPTSVPQAALRFYQQGLVLLPIPFVGPQVVMLTLRAETI